MGSGFLNLKMGQEYYNKAFTEDFKIKDLSEQLKNSARKDLLQKE
jgi:hypothetical protein